MVLKEQRLDVTDRITGKLAEGQVNLFMEEQPIGTLIYRASGVPQYDLKNGFESEGYKIFQKVSVTTGYDQKYVDCDYENGWC